MFLPNCQYQTVLLVRGLRCQPASNHFTAADRNALAMAYRTLRASAGPRSLRRNIIESGLGRVIAWAPARTALLCHCGKPLTKAGFCSAATR